MISLIQDRASISSPHSAMYRTSTVETSKMIGRGGAPKEEQGKEGSV
jgi:hypothetical protein